MKLTVNWTNRSEVLSYLRSFAGARAKQPLMEAVGRAAIRVQQIVRNNLESMVYSQPPASSGYARTRTLLRSAHAARPSTDHSGDEGRARGGADLVATQPLDVVEMRGDTIASEIGSWISYSEYVHQGVDQPSPRPYLRSAEDQAGDILEEEVDRAVEQMARR